MTTKAILVFVLCLLGWSAVAYHVYQGYGIDQAIGIVGFGLAALGHAIQFDVIGIQTSAESADHLHSTEQGK